MNYIENIICKSDSSIYGGVIFPKITLVNIYVMIYFQMVQHSIMNNFLKDFFREVGVRK